MMISVVQGINWRRIGDASFRHYLDLLKFRSRNAKILRHIDDLIRTYEVGGLGAEFFYTGSKFAALHCFRGVQAKATCTFRGVKQTEFANNHFQPPQSAIILRMRMNQSPYAIRE